MDRLEIIRKVRELADRGVDGEQAAAQKMLERLMDKYGISFSDIEDEDKIESRSMRVHNASRWIFFGIIAKVTQPEGGIRYGAKGNVITIRLTLSDYIIVQSMYDHLYKLYIDEKKALRKAFQMKHKLWSDKATSTRQMTQKEYESYLKGLAMMGNLKDANFNKQLDKG
jgi:hypothetical protein